MKVRVFQVSRDRDKLGERKCPWSIEWRDPSSGRKRSKLIGSKKLAKEAAEAKQKQLLQQNFGQVEDKPWLEFVEEYDTKHIQHELRSDSSRREARRVLSLFGRMMQPRLVASIDEAMIDEYISKRRLQPGKKVGSTVSAATIRKELRTLLAALAKAKRWKYITRVPDKPAVKGVETEKRFVTKEHFTAMLAAVGRNDCPASYPVGFEYGDIWTPADWWTSLLLTAWITGMRKSALLALKWEDLDVDGGTVLSRGVDNKGKRPHLVKLGPVLGLLDGLKGTDPRMFPWDHALTLFDAQLVAIQNAAGIHLPCVLDQPHECTPRCHCYSMHDFRRAHATYHYGEVSDRDLQEQMGHADFSTTRSYAKYARTHQKAAYSHQLPDEVMAGLEP